jgi:hypothetical protein
MTALLECGLTSSHLTKIAFLMTFQDLYGLTKTGFDHFQGELTKCLPLVSDKQLKSTFEYLVGRHSEGTG